MAFNTLDRARESSISEVGGLWEQPIRYSEISRYARDWGFTEDTTDFRLFLAVLQRMDIEARTLKRNVRRG